MPFEITIESLQRSYKRWQFTTAKQYAFLEDLSVLIDDGVPPNKAIEMLCRIYTGILKEAALDLAKNLSKGLTLAEGMRDWFQVNVIELVRVGEEGGALAQTIKSAANALKEKKGALGSVIAALIYPLTVIIAGCAVMVYLKHSVFIDFATIKPVATWPSSGQHLLMFATFIQYWFWLVILLIIGAIFGLKHSLAVYVGELRVTLDKLPIYSLYRKLTAAQFMETLGLLIANGVVFKSALKIVQYSANPYVMSHLMIMEHLLAKGKDNIAEVLDTGLINKNDILRLRVIAEAKGFEHALIRLGQYATENGMKTIRKTAKISGGALLAVGGIMIVFMILAIYSVGMFLGTAGV